MEGENINQKAVFCEDDGEGRVYCDICDKLCIERFYKKHLNSSTHITKIRNRQQFNNINVRNEYN